MFNFHRNNSDGPSGASSIVRKSPLLYGPRDERVVSVEEINGRYRFHYLSVFDIWMALELVAVLNFTLWRLN